MSKRDEKRKAILEGACDALLELGPDRITLDDIAVRAGVAKTSLYYYFSGKDGILHAVILKELADILETVRKAVAGPETAEGKLHALVEARHSLISGKAQCLYREIIEQSGSLSEIFISERGFFLKALREIIEEILREGIRKREIGQIGDLDTVSLIMIASVVGCDYAFLIADRDEHVQDTFGQMMELFWAGLKAGAVQTLRSQAHQG